MRVDVPTLRCDRCGTETQDLTEMGHFNTLTHHHVSGSDSWDLCPSCWGAWSDFLKFQTRHLPPAAGAGGEGK